MFRIPNCRPATQAMVEAMPPRTAYASLEATATIQAGFDLARLTGQLESGSAMDFRCIT